MLEAVPERLHERVCGALRSAGQGKNVENDRKVMAPLIAPASGSDAYGLVIARLTEMGCRVDDDNGDEDR
jgi:hypothetical protein